MSMQKARTFLILGVWTAILPYLGFPSSWKSVLFTLTGLSLIYLSYAMYQDHKKEHVPHDSFDNFRENADFQKIKTSTQTPEENSPEEAG